MSSKGAEDMAGRRCVQDVAGRCCRTVLQDGLLGVQDGAPPAHSAALIVIAHTDSINACWIRVLALSDESPSPCCCACAAGAVKAVAAQAGRFKPH